MCDGAQQLVAGEVTEAVVDVLETVEVEEEDGEALLRVPSSTGERVPQAVHQHCSIGQPGERLLEARHAHRLARLVLDLDVGLAADDADGAPGGIADDLALGQHPTVIAVGEPHPVALLEDRDLAGDGGVEDLPETGEVLGVDAAQPLLEVVRDLVRRVAEHGLPALGEVDRVGLEIQVPDAVVAAAGGDQETVVLGRDPFLHLSHLGKLIDARLDEAEPRGHVGGVQGQDEVVADAELEEPLQVSGAVSRHEGEQEAWTTVARRVQESVDEPGECPLTEPPVDHRQVGKGPVPGGADRPRVVVHGVLVPALTEDLRQLCGGAPVTADDDSATEGALERLR